MKRILNISVQLGGEGSVKGREKVLKGEKRPCLLKNISLHQGSPTSILDFMISKRAAFCNSLETETFQMDGT